MSFDESNTVEAFVRDRLCGGVTHHTAVGPGLARRLGRISGLGWHFLARQNVPRQLHEVIVENQPLVAQVRSGKDGVVNALVGQVMKKTRGAANPQLAGELLRARISATGSSTP